MSARSYWAEIHAADQRETRLPKWARERLDDLRREVARLLRGLDTKSELPSDARVLLNIGSDGHGESIVRHLPDGAEVVLRVTGGEMHVRLSEFGGRYRVRITGMGAWDSLFRERHEIAVLPAMGNVVEVAFVMPAVASLDAAQAIEVGQSQLALSHEVTGTGNEKEGDI